MMEGQTYEWMDEQLKNIWACAWQNLQNEVFKSKTYFNKQYLTYR